MVGILAFECFGGGSAGDAQIKHLFGEQGSFRDGDVDFATFSRIPSDTWHVQLFAENAKEGLALGEPSRDPHLPDGLFSAALEKSNRAPDFACERPERHAGIFHHQLVLMG